MVYTEPKVVQELNQQTKQSYIIMATIKRITDVTIYIFNGFTGI